MTSSTPDPIALRILDANANRVLEGLRVVEEFQRFALDDPILTQEWKQLRHDLSSALQQLPRAERLAARDTERDVGTQLTTSQERARGDLGAIVAANLQRVLEALRVLEEYAKLSWPSLASQAKTLRYRVYSLEKRLSAGAALRSRLWAARLYVLIDGGRDEADFRRRGDALIAAGVQVLQLRDKRLNDRQLLCRARLLRDMTHGTATLFIMNDRADVGRLARADGLHVGQEEIPVSDARQILGLGPLLGVSTHSPAQADQAAWEGADYIGCGPTFPSHTKDFSEFPGLALLTSIAARTTIPAFAIGGIREENLDQVLATGIRRVAVQQAIWGNQDPGAAARRFLDCLPPLHLPSPLGPPVDQTPAETQKS